ncbi:uncharacterized protein LOC143059625 [Mytilus galloprovincialis]|uniref:uncharacterized protein LOC143059625 n=1 Tax=Mytilus galloprovincialis TaxID=29158 RepID=UPI003F7C6AB0
MSAATLAIMLMVSVHICHGKISVTYAFPTDSCVSDPYLVDEDTMVIMKFEGDIGSQECRQMSFTTPKSAFYSYTMCMKELYYSSPKCQSKVYFRWYWSYYDYDYIDSYDYYNSKEISGVGCSYETIRMFSRCLYDGSHVSFELRKSEKVVPDNVNDTFKFQIETKWDFNYEMIGGISGGIVGMCIFTGVGIYVCINCRRRKRVTGTYCCTCPTYVLSCSKSMKEGIAQGFSAELAGAGILLCSCVICRRQNCTQQEQDQCEKVTMETDCTSTDSENKGEAVTGETVTGFKDQDTAPLCDS